MQNAGLHSRTRKELSPYAPKIITTTIDPDKIRDVIGPGQGHQWYHCRNWGQDRH